MRYVGPASFLARERSPRPRPRGRHRARALDPPHLSRHPRVFPTGRPCFPRNARARHGSSETTTTRCLICQYEFAPDDRVTLAHCHLCDAVTCTHDACSVKACLVCTKKGVVRHAALRHGDVRRLTLLECTFAPCPEVALEFFLMRRLLDKINDAHPGTIARFEKRVTQELYMPLQRAVVSKHSYDIEHACRVLLGIMLATLRETPPGIEVPMNDRMYIDTWWYSLVDNDKRLYDDVTRELGRIFQTRYVRFDDRLWIYKPETSCDKTRVVLLHEDRQWEEVRGAELVTLLYFDSAPAHAKQKLGGREYATREQLFNDIGGPIAERDVVRSVPRRYSWFYGGGDDVVKELQEVLPDVACKILLRLLHKHADAMTILKVLFSFFKRDLDLEIPEDKIRITVETLRRHHVIGRPTPATAADTKPVPAAKTTATEPPAACMTVVQAIVQTTGSLVPPTARKTTTAKPPVPAKRPVHAKPPAPPTAVKPAAVPKQSAPPPLDALARALRGQISDERCDQLAILELRRKEMTLTALRTAIRGVVAGDDALFKRAIQELHAPARRSRLPRAWTRVCNALNTAEERAAAEAALRKLPPDAKMDDVHLAVACAVSEADARSAEPCPADDDVTTDTGSEAPTDVNDETPDGATEDGAAVVPDEAAALHLLGEVAAERSKAADGGATLEDVVRALRGKVADDKCEALLTMVRDADFWSRAQELLGPDDCATLKRTFEELVDAYGSVRVSRDSDRKRRRVETGMTDFFDEREYTGDSFEGYMSWLVRGKGAAACARRAAQSEVQFAVRSGTSSWTLVQPRAILRTAAHGRATFSYAGDVRVQDVTSTLANEADARFVAVLRGLRLPDFNQALHMMRMVVAENAVEVDLDAVDEATRSRVAHWVKNKTRKVPKKESLRSQVEAALHRLFVGHGDSVSFDELRREVSDATHEALEATLKECEEENIVMYRNGRIYLI